MKIGKVLGLHRMVSAVSSLVLLALFLMSSSWQAAARASLASADQPPVSAMPGDFKPGEVLVMFEPGMAGGKEEPLRARYGAAYVGSIFGVDVAIWQVPEGQEWSIVEELVGEPMVAHAQLNYLYHALGTPNDPHFSKQWAHTKIQSPAAWDISGGSSSITIAVIDTGIDETHPDLASRIVAGYDFVGNDADPHDLNGHGTHAAGIAAAATDNGTGVAGMDWQARIMPVRVLDESGGGYTSNVVSGINWAVAHGADVLNLSLGTTSNDWYLQNAVTNAHAAGSLVVAAMGNDRDANPTNYPAACENAMAVAATDRWDSYAYYSQYGTHCDIAAPGGAMYDYQDPNGIYSTMPTYDVYMTIYEDYWQSYDYLQGTSMAAPYVAGLAALVWSLDPTLSPDQVQATIENTAVDLGPIGWDVNYGHGRIDALAALLEALDPPSAPIMPSIGNPDGDGAYLVDWNDVPTAASYTLQEDNHSTFTSPTVVYIGAESQLNVTGHIGGTWFYRVRASNEAGDSPWSNTQPVAVKPTAPLLDSISNPSGDDAYVVSWSAPDGAAAYRLEEDDNSAFTSPVVRYEGSMHQYTVTGQPQGAWYYRVLAYNAAGQSPCSNTSNTSVAARPLPAPVLSPIGNPDGDGTYTVDWSDISGATGYTLEESSSPYFSSPEAVYAGDASQFDVASQPGGKWYYRARATGAAGSGPWSNPQSAVVTSYLFMPMAVRAFDQDVLIDEGFEGGSVPPAGWTLIQDNPSFTWGPWPFSPPWSAYPLAHEGSYSAAVVPDWEYDQNEVLLSPPFEASDALLEFYSFGSPMLCGPYPGFNWCDLKIWLVVDDWDSGTNDDIYVGMADSDWLGELVWSQSSWDLSSYLPAGTPVRLGFEYEGIDGEVIGLDSIRVTRQQLRARRSHVPMRPVCMGVALPSSSSLLVLRLPYAILTLETTG